MRKQNYFFILLFFSLFSHSQINLLQNFDSSTSLPTGFTGQASINTTPAFSCSINNSLALASIPNVPKTFTYQSGYVLEASKNLNLNFNYYYQRSNVGSSILYISYIIYNQTNNISDNLTQIAILPSYPITPINCIVFNASIPGNLIENNAKIVFNFNFVSAPNSLAFNYFYIDDFKINQTNSLSTNNFDTNQNFIIYPNPFTNKLKLKNYENISILTITDLNGKEIFRIMNPKEDINTEAFPQGIYIISTTNKEGVINNNKFIKI